MIQTTEFSQFQYSSIITKYQSVSAEKSTSSTGNTDKTTLFSGDRVHLSYSAVEQQSIYKSTGIVESTAQDAYDLLRNYVLDTFNKQGMDTVFSAGDQDVDLQTLSQQDAQSLIAENGYFGIDQTSSRIVDFATGIAGNDPSRLQTIKDGVEKGFNDALKAFGGWLPDISHSTYDAVMEKLDKWAETQQSG